MSKIAKYLQDHLEGEVTDLLEARRHFATDSSVLKVQPTCVVYPRNEDDIRKVCRFAWQLAERGHKLPITIRGAGGDISGGAVGSGIVMLSGIHIDRILYLNSRKKEISVEPGINIDKLQQTLFTHGLFLPAYPKNQKLATAGGVIGGNAGGETAWRQGSISSYLQSARVVLADGEVIEAAPLSKKELNLKMGLSSHEGEIYRELDALFEETAPLIKEAKSKLAHLRVNAAGYNIFGAESSGEFNLLPLLAGSQGTLGIITEASLRLEAFTPPIHTALISLGRLNSLKTLLPELLKLQPTMCEFINQAVVEQVMNTSPSFYEDVLERPQAAMHLVVEFSDQREAGQKKAMNVLRSIAQKHGADFGMVSDSSGRDNLYRVSQSTNLLKVAVDSRSAPVSLMSVAVPPVLLSDFLEKVYQAYKSAELAPAVYGHAAGGVVYIDAALDLSQVGDRQRLFKLTDSISKNAISFGGTIAAVGGEGRLHAHKLSEQYDQKLWEVMREVKKIFDPFNILNPGVKFGTSERDVKILLNNSYHPSHKYDIL